MMKHKHNSLPCQSTSRSKMIVKKNSLNINKKQRCGDGLRRSSRKAALERRVWAEPRKGRPPILKSLHEGSAMIVSPARRGRPPLKKNKLGLSSVNNKTIQKIIKNNIKFTNKELCEGSINDKDVKEKIETSMELEGVLVLDEGDANLDDVVVDEVVSDLNSFQKSDKDENSHAISTNISSGTSKNTSFTDSSYNNSDYVLPNKLDTFTENNEAIDFSLKGKNCMKTNCNNTKSDLYQSSNNDTINIEKPNQTLVNPMSSQLVMNSVPQIEKYFSNSNESLLKDSSSNVRDYSMKENKSETDAVFLQTSNSISTHLISSIEKFECLDLSKPKKFPVISVPNNEKSSNDSNALLIFNSNKSSVEEQTSLLKSEIQGPHFKMDHADDDSHVSLSEALAKLVDSDESGQGSETETVTIHPVLNKEEGPLKALLDSPRLASALTPSSFINTSTTISLESRLATALTATSANSTVNLFTKNMKMTAVSDSNSIEEKVSVNLSTASWVSKIPIVKNENFDNFEKKFDKKNSRSLTNFSFKDFDLKHENTNKVAFSDANHIKPKNHFVKNEAENVESDKSFDVMADSFFSEESWKEKRRSKVPPVPPLIKISNQSPIIKIPLKCSECAMRFSTVRSLLWHFGTHEASPSSPTRPTKSCVLDDLVAAWDRPEVPVINDNLEIKKIEDEIDSLPRKRSGSRECILKVPVPRFKFSGSSQQQGNGKLFSAMSSEVSPFVTGMPKPSASQHFDESRSDDGLVLMNGGLALRIVSPSASGSTDINHATTDSLTITPQPRGVNTSRSSIKLPAPPDILTIVPQSTSRRRSSDAPRLMTAAGAVTPDGGVRLVLPTKSDADSDSDGEMVIDEGNSVMDPLSMVAVTMDDAEDFSRGTLEEKCGSKKRLKNATPRPSSPLECDGEPSDDVSLPISAEEEKYRRRRYVCGFCSKRFGWSTDLKRHVILHTGERPFKCKWCDVAFTRKFLLQNHMKRLHAPLCRWTDLWE